MNKKSLGTLFHLIFFRPCITTLYEYTKRISIINKHSTNQTANERFHHEKLDEKKRRNFIDNSRKKKRKDSHSFFVLLKLIELKDFLVFLIKGLVFLSHSYDNGE